VCVLHQLRQCFGKILTAAEQRTPGRSELDSVSQSSAPIEGQDNTPTPTTNGSQFNMPLGL